MWPKPQETADLVTFTEEILNGKVHFLCSAVWLVVKGNCVKTTRNPAELFLADQKGTLWRKKVMPCMFNRILNTLLLFTMLNFKFIVGVHKTTARKDGRENDRVIFSIKRSIIDVWQGPKMNDSTEQNEEHQY